MVCVKGWFLWIPLHKPFKILCITSLHSNHPFTQTMHHSLYYLLYSLCDYLVCVNKWFVWRDGLCEGIIGLCEGMTSLHTNHPFTQTIYSHKPNNHTNQIIWNTENYKWFYHSLYYFYKPYIISLHTIRIILYPFTQTNPSHKSFIILCITSLCTNHPFTETIPSHKPFLHTNHPFTQPIYHSLYYILSGLCDYLVCLNYIHSHKPSLPTNHSPFSGLQIIWVVWLSGLCE